MLKYVTSSHPRRAFDTAARPAVARFGASLPLGAAMLMNRTAMRSIKSCCLFRNDSQRGCYFFDDRDLDAIDHRQPAASEALQQRLAFGVVRIWLGVVQRPRDRSDYARARSATSAATRQGETVRFQPGAQEYRRRTPRPLRARPRRTGQLVAMQLNETRVRLLKLELQRVAIERAHAFDCRGRSRTASCLSTPRRAALPCRRSSARSASRSLATSSADRRSA